MRTTGGSPYGGTAVAAAFLQKFVDTKADENAKSHPKWVHIDIGGPGIYSKAREFMPEGGTGYGSALLTEAVKNL